MKIYTKTGDKGETSLFDGTRVRKNHLRVEAYGTIDELNSYIGTISTFDIAEREKDILKQINFFLFSIGTDLATPDETRLPKNFRRIGVTDIEFLEEMIDFYTSDLPELQNFILPGGCFEASFIHVARTVCRRAERCVIQLGEKEKVNPNIVVYLNRLSDFLFVLARFINKFKGFNDIIWKNEKM